MTTNTRLLPTLASAASLLLASPAFGLDYLNEKALEAAVKKLARDHSKLAHLETLAKTTEKNEVFLLTLGYGKPEELKARPAMLVTAGLEGNDLAGPVSVLHWVDSLLASAKTNTETARLLETTTLYVVPQLNPDAALQFFAKVKRETPTNARPVDDDHDGLTDEDGPEDLDGDGLITSMRVEDADGDYIPDPTDARLLIKADKLKGEKGRYRLLTEGVDNDKDERWNEDGPGGVNFNRNFSFNHTFFGADAGIHPVSEVETRALADFVVAHPNIGIAFTFGSPDNLVQTPKGEPRGTSNKPRTNLQEEDLGLYRELGKLWRDTLGLKKELQTSTEPGSFSDWMYYHRGRLSLAAKPWSPALQAEFTPAAKPAETKDTNKPPASVEKMETEPKPPGGEKEKDARNEAERVFLKWLETNSPPGFVNWKSFAHPDFPGKKVEIGGFAPFAKSNPPAKLLNGLAAKHARFLTALAGRLPRIGLRETRIKALGEGLYDITLKVENSGYLPVSIAQGSVTREVFPTQVRLKLEDKQVLSGSRITRLDNLEGSGGVKEIRWVVQAAKLERLEVEIDSMLGGNLRTSLDLKGATK